MNYEIKFTGGNSFICGSLIVYAKDASHALSLVQSHIDVMGATVVSINPART